MRRLLILLTLMPVSALADPEPWMKKENSNELPVTVFSTCSKLAMDEGLRIVDGVLTRSRIKSVRADPSVSANFPWLLIFIRCADDLSKCGTNVDFVNEDSQGYRHRQGITGYGSHGYCAGDVAFFRERLREGVEAAITDYLRANFNLGEDV